MSRNFASRLVQLSQSSGLAVTVYGFSNGKIARQGQKLKSLTRYVQSHPTGWKKRLELANLLYEMGHWSQAVAEYRQVLARQSHLLAVRLKLAKMLEIMGQKEEAIAAYQEALPLADHLATRHHIQALISACQADYQQTGQWLELATSLEPDNAAHWLALAEGWREREQPREALSAYYQVLSLQPDDLRSLSRVYDLLMMAGEIEQADGCLGQLRDLAPQDRGVIERLAYRRLQQGLIAGEAGKETKQLIHNLRRIAPEMAEAHDLLAYYYLLKGERQKAIATWQEFSQKYPYQPYGWYYYGMGLWQAGDWENAAEAMMEAYQRYPQDCEIYRALGEILPLAGKQAQLYPLIESMVATFSHRWTIWATAGRVLVETFGEIDRGCLFSSKGVELQPQLADAWFRHGRVLSLAGKSREAVRALRQGWQLLPESETAVWAVPAAAWLAESYRELGEGETSQQWWEIARERSLLLMAFNPIIAAYWQGRAWEGLGEREKAVTAYQSALEGHLPYPACDEVKTALQRLKARGKVKRHPQSG